MRVLVRLGAVGRVLVIMRPVLAGMVVVVDVVRRSMLVRMFVLVRMGMRMNMLVRVTVFALTGMLMLVLVLVFVLVLVLVPVLVIAFHRLPPVDKGLSGLGRAAWRSGDRPDRVLLKR